MDNTTPHTVPSPAPPAPEGDLPRVLCFALTAGERAAVLRVLRRYGPDRSCALKAALGIETTDHHTPGKGRARGA